MLVSYRSGDMWSPKAEQTEALRVELCYFIDRIVNNKRPLNDGMAGLSVVNMPEAAKKVHQRAGKAVLL
jgi:hypothetical protein